MLGYIKLGPWKCPGKKMNGPDSQYYFQDGDFCIPMVSAIYYFSASSGFLWALVFELLGIAHLQV